MIHPTIKHNHYILTTNGYVKIKNLTTNHLIVDHLSNISPIIQIKSINNSLSAKLNHNNNTTLLNSNALILATKIAQKPYIQKINNPNFIPINQLNNHAHLSITSLNLPQPTLPHELQPKHLFQLIAKFIKNGSISNNQITIHIQSKQFKFKLPKYFKEFSISIKPHKAYDITIHNNNINNFIINNFNKIIPPWTYNSPHINHFLPIFFKDNLYTFNPPITLAIADIINSRKDKIYNKHLHTLAIPLFNNPQYPKLLLSYKIKSSNLIKYNDTFFNLHKIFFSMNTLHQPQKFFAIKSNASSFIINSLIIGNNIHPINNSNT